MHSGLLNSNPWARRDVHIGIYQNMVRTPDISLAQSVDCGQL
jgi:hypothetical protein